MIILKNYMVILIADISIQNTIISKNIELRCNCINFNCTMVPFEANILHSLFEMNSSIFTNESPM